MAGSATTFANTAGGKKQPIIREQFKSSAMLPPEEMAVTMPGATAEQRPNLQNVRSLAKAGGDSAGNNSGTTAKSTKTSAQTVPKAGGDVAENGGESIGETAVTATRHL